MVVNLNFYFNGAMYVGAAVVRVLVQLPRNYILLFISPFTYTHTHIIQIDVRARAQFFPIWNVFMCLFNSVIFIRYGEATGNVYVLVSTPPFNPFIHNNNNFVHPMLFSSYPELGIINLILLLFSNGLKSFCAYV